MSVSYALHPPAAPLGIQPQPVAPYSQGLGGKQSAFAEALGRQLVPQAAANATPEARARSGAEQLVSVAFVQPILKQLRETDHAAPPFAPTQAEKQMRALGDAELAHRIVHAARFPLVDRLARDLLKKGGKDPQGRSVNNELAKARSRTPDPSPGVTLGADGR